VSPVLQICSACGKVVARKIRGRCESCYRAWTRERNRRPNHKVWNGAAWKRARRAAKTRDENRCAFVDDTGERCAATTDLTVHHRVALKEGGAMYDLDNLVTLCRMHHGSLEGRRSHARL